MPFWSVNASVSSAAIKFDAIRNVAPSRYASSESRIVNEAGRKVVAPSFSVYAWTLPK